ncbi:MAG TPA: metallophosphoesterase [Nanoarchaeota archaeon]|nr:metallophosphoesterase [Candidatus Woesearchaeota archaeon]HIH15220.1 metallophosphoesterase [Nanoarchaeota archaeon]HIH59550.1 metallophosphoesterase [Nanoarchaeota archaeon]HII14178.1 metallophosphoesterase [Nanoarchaeota archaeon]HIJ05512.1 metallophosphoesterase [Nanoarchaeota archaeon]
MLIHDNIEIRDLGLYLIKEKTLIISDIHIGFEEALNRQGVLIPRVYLREFFERLQKMLDNVDTVVLNGDIKHEFAGMSSSEWQGTDELFRVLEGKNIIIIKGNHDPILPFVLKVKILPFLKIGNVLIAHGDTILEEEAKVIIIGHEHCAIGLKEGVRIEKFKCFLKGKYKKSILLAMPSSNLATEGTDVLRSERISPYLKQNLGNFEVFILSDKVYAFGKVKKLQ